MMVVGIVPGIILVPVNRVLTEVSPTRSGNLRTGEADAKGRELMMTSLSQGCAISEICTHFFTTSTQTFLLPSSMAFIPTDGPGT